jgi:hypothetical protein
MSVILEIYYKAPEDLAREARLSGEVAKLRGSFSFKEQPEGAASEAICLTYEFPSREAAEHAATAIRSAGEHVEGPYDYD